MEKATKRIFEEANQVFLGLHIADAAKVAPEFRLEKVKSKIRETKVKAEDIQRV